MRYFNFFYKQNLKLILLMSLFISLYCIYPVNAQHNRLSTRSGQEIFSSGMNMAWANNFSGNAVSFIEQDFIDALDEISAAGGNTMRWWLHINGTQSPLFENDTVSGLSTEIENVRRILDLAYERRMTICISLWSHDMLKDEGGQDLDMILYMLEDTIGTMAYVNNALIPLVEGVKGHPAILCWEIFNEPEGMLNTSFPEAPWSGWTTRKTNYDAIKRFTNLCAGAIHRTDPGALVTTGAHRIAYVADIGSVPNNYADSILIEAGGDSLGYLDFYQVHYYADFGTSLSPFAYPISHWNVDKPVVIGEFSAHGPEGEGESPTPQEAYQYLFDNGYAGAWSWTWTGHDGNGDVNDAKEGMLPLAQNYPEDILIKAPGGWIEEFAVDTTRIIAGDSVKVKWRASDSSLVSLNGMIFNEIDSTWLSPQETTDFTLIASGDFHADSIKFTITVLKLGNIDYFTAESKSIEQGDSSLLKWNVILGETTQVTLNGVPVAGNDSIYVSPLSDSVFVLASDGPDPDTSSILITVLNELAVNRALNSPVYASTFETCCGDPLIAEYAVDGDSLTRWSSAWGTGDPVDPNTDSNPNDEWIYIDFGKSYDIENVKLSWEEAYGSVYDLDVSFDGYLWQTIYNETTGDGAKDNIILEERPAGRYLRMHGKNRASEYGYSLWEIEAYGVSSQKLPPSISLNTTSSNVVQPSANVTITADAVDEDGTIANVAFYADGQLLATDDESPYQAEWQAGEESIYALTAVATDNDSLSVQSDTFKVYIDDDTFVRYEAEDASTSGEATRVNNGATSGGAFMELRADWTITWNNINVEQSAEYLLSIAYQLTFDTPKSQYLVVNGDTVDVIEFTAPNTTAWLQKGLFISLQQGSNTIALHGFWNWMSLDFIAVKGAAIVSVEDENRIPDTYALMQNYPNPFNPQTTIKFMLKKREKATITIYNTLGRKIKTVYNAETDAGANSVIWSGDNDAGKAVSSGIYFYKLQTESGFSKTRKMILMK